jgi:hypothetical protein
MRKISKIYNSAHDIEIGLYGADGAAYRNKVKLRVRRRIVVSWLGYAVLMVLLVVFLNPWSGGFSWFRLAAIWFSLGAYRECHLWQVARARKMADAELRLAGLSDKNGDEMLQGLARAMNLGGGK